MLIFNILDLSHNFSGQIYGLILKKNKIDSFLFNAVVVALTPSGQLPHA